MGQYYTEAVINFKSTSDEEIKFKKLLILMNKDSTYDKKQFNKIPIVLSNVIENALFGQLEDRGENSDYFCRFFPDFTLNLAPQLFASLFPNASFSIYISYEYSSGGGKTIFNAEYANKILSVKDCQTCLDIDELDKYTRDQYDNGELSSDDIGNYLLNLHEKRIIQPSRNPHYEKSFFNGTNLLTYLNNIK